MRVGVGERCETLSERGSQCLRLRCVITRVLQIVREGLQLAAQGLRGVARHGVQGILLAQARPLAQLLQLRRRRLGRVIQQPVQAPPKLAPGALIGAEDRIFGDAFAQCLRLPPEVELQGAHASDQILPAHRREDFRSAAGLIPAGFVERSTGRLGGLERGRFADLPLAIVEKRADCLRHLRQPCVHEHLVAVTVGITLLEFIDGHGNQRARREDVLEAQATHRVHVRRQPVTLAALRPARMDLHVFRRPDPLRVVVLRPERVGHHDGDPLAVQHRCIIGVADGCGSAFVPGGVAVLECKSRFQESRGGIALLGGADALGGHGNQVRLVVGRLAEQYRPAGAIERAACFAGQVELVIRRRDGNALDAGDARAGQQVVELGLAELARAAGRVRFPQRGVGVQ